MVRSLKQSSLDFTHQDEFLSLLDNLFCGTWRSSVRKKQMVLSSCIMGSVGSRIVFFKLDHLKSYSFCNVFFLLNLFYVDATYAWFSLTGTFQKDSFSSILSRSLNFSSSMIPSLYDVLSCHVMVEM